MLVAEERAERAAGVRLMARERLGRRARLAQAAHAIVALRRERGRRQRAERTEPALAAVGHVLREVVIAASVGVVW